jgi:hypothetical protein
LIENVGKDETRARIDGHQLHPGLNQSRLQRRSAPGMVEHVAVEQLDALIAGRADLGEGAASKARELLRRYLDQRIVFYLTADPGRLKQIRADTDKLSAELWALARSGALAQPTPVAALVTAAMNDVLNSGDYTTAAWLNRIPVPAWWLLVMIGVGSNLTIGLGAKRFNLLLLTVLPLTVAISLFLIADIDSPRGSVVEVVPPNLSRLAA